jgi:DNA-binding XRE family transcriptional regulator
MHHGGSVILLDGKSSIMDKMDINKLIAGRVLALREARQLSLTALAELSGVSRSNISLIERGESSATATVLDKLAGALGVRRALAAAARRRAAGVDRPGLRLRAAAFVAGGTFAVATGRGGVSAGPARGL